MAAVAFGIITLVWHDFNNWQQIRAFGNVCRREILVYVGCGPDLRGVATQRPRTARAGDFALAAIYLMFALLWVPRVVAELRVLTAGVPFRELSLVSGALIVYGALSPADSTRPGRAARIGYIFFGICVVSFTTYLSGTAYSLPTITAVFRFICPQPGDSAVFVLLPSVLPLSPVANSTLASSCELFVKAMFLV